jgi:hydroxyacylglutathione hydrolase
MTAISPGQETSPHTAQQLRQVHTITDRFGMLNTYVIDDGALVVVDPRSSLNGRLIVDYIERYLERTPAEIDLIVLTHLETNHGGGIEVLQRHCRAPVAALASPGSGGERRGGERSPRDWLAPLYAHQLRQVSIWLHDVEGLPQHEDWRVIASGSLARGHLCLYNPFSWELIGGASISTTEWGTPILHSAGNRQLLQDTLRLLRSLNIYYLYPGQGKPLLAHNAATHIQPEW